MLSKSLSTSTKRARLHRVLGPLAEFAQALYPLLVAHADDFGREAGDPFTVKTAVDPSSPRSLVDVGEALLGLRDVGLVQIYLVGDDRYVLQIVDFDAHQSGLHKRTASRFPAPPDDSGNFREFPGTSVSRARGRELELELEPNLTIKNAAARRADLPQPVEKPKVQTLAALLRVELLPKLNGDAAEGDVVEAAKHLAARHHLRYTGSAIRRALASARGQLAKRRP